MNILEEIFLGNISGTQRKMPPEYKIACEVELKLYNQLKQELPEDKIELFEKYVKATETTLEITEKDFYINGLKTGILIGVESSKKDL